MSAENAAEQTRPDSASDGESLLLIGLRYVLPAVVVLAGIIVMLLGSEVDLEGGASIVSAGLAIYAMSWLYRASVDGDRERDEEEAARTYFGTHGRWPGEAPARSIPTGAQTRAARRRG